MVYTSVDLTLNQQDIEAGSVVASKVQELINSHDILVFSKTTCPFCLELKRTLASYGVQFAVFEVDLSPAGPQIQQALKDMTNISTVPNLFVNKKSLGGCIDVKSLESEGVLLAQLAPYVGKQRNPGPRVHSLGLLYFPETVNANVVRYTSLCSAIYCILCVIFYKRYSTRWAVLALALEYFARFVYGGQHSIIGSIVAAFLVNVPPRWAAGPPKQFAASCGLFFSVFGAGLYLGGRSVGGAIVIALLAGAATLEGVFDFCLGCWMFGLAIRYKLISGSIYQPYLNIIAGRKWAYNFANEKRNYPVAQNEHVLLPGQYEESKIDLIRKIRIETEYKLQDFDLIRHTKVDFFAVPMAIAALAYFYKLTDNTSSSANFNGGYAYQVLAVTSVIIGCIFFAIYALRLALYPKKFLKEWNHPSYGNYFSAITITVTLYGILLLPKSVNGGGALIWIGAVGQMLITVLRVADLVFKPVSDEFLNPSLMMSPVGNYICAIGFSMFGNTYEGPSLRGNVHYTYLSRMWFAIASLFAIVLFTITFKRTFQEHYSDARNRPTLFVWLATASIAGPAYLAATNENVGTGLFFQSMWYIALFFFAIFAIGWMKNFFTYEKDMSMWIIPFSFSAFAICTIEYQLAAPSQLFTTLSIITGVIASISTIVTGAQTLGAIFDGTLFLPRPKWGPVTFMKLTHESMRISIPKMLTILNVLDAKHAVAVDDFVADLEAFFIAYEEHGRHEEEIIFPRVRRYFPGLNPSMSEEHERDHATFSKIVEEIKKFRTNLSTAENDSARQTVTAALLTFLKNHLITWGNDVLEHFRNEENSVTVAVRKYIPIDYQKQMTADVFDLTSGSKWRIILPYVLKNLINPQWKARYVRTFLWANPLRAQEIGLMLYPTVDSVTWALLAREMPEIIPRGLCGHSRYY